MKTMNRVFLLGHLGQTPQLAQTKAGKAYTRLNVATHRSFQDDENNWQERTTWHSVFVFSPLAEKYAEKLTKGALVFVEGSLSQYAAESGEASNRTTVHAHNIRFLNRPQTAAAKGFEESC